LSRRRRWRPVEGYRSRVYLARERWLLRLLDLPSMLLRRRVRAAMEAPPLDRHGVERVLVLRLDRIGDVVMSLPALVDLRDAVPHAHVTLVVGRWSAPIARRAPVDEIVVWNAPWVGRRNEGASSTVGLLRRARALGRQGFDLAIDLQGDVRAAQLMAMTRARARVGYLNTGGGWLLTHGVPLDETVSWVEQNRRAVRVALGPSGTSGRFPPMVSDAERQAARRTLSEAGAVRRPRIGIHPSGGRRIKEWPVARWAAVAQGLLAAYDAMIVVTGSEADRALAASLVQSLGPRAVNLCGLLPVEKTLAVIAELDLFLSSDTGPMHLAAAVDTPSVSLFGPSDPTRYFSGEIGARHVVAHADLWCAPCNLIRRPPGECARRPPPECLSLVSVDEILAAATRVLEASGIRRRPGGGD
jgi:ADP-heptose:LPS heptosyltransferase